MRLSTIRIRNKKTGDTRKINLHEWTSDLGMSKYVDWERVGGETVGEETAKDVKEMQTESASQHEKIHDSEPEKVNDSGKTMEGLPPKAKTTGNRSTRRGANK